MKEKMSRKTVSIITVAGIGILLAAALLASSVTVIPTGYTGVRSTFGQISEKPVSSGLKLKVPLIQSIEKVNNKQQDIVFNSQIWSETKERTAIYYADVTVTYQISPEKSTWIYANVTNYRDNLVSQDLVASAIKASSKELSDTDATNRSIIEPQAMENIQKAFDEKYGKNVVVINKVVIGNADFDDSYNEAIAAKQKATLEAQQQAIENQKAIDKAKADASVIKTTAEAEAEAKVIAAQAEADANKLLEESLSDSVLKDKYLEKWDGSLPKYVGGDGSNILIGMEE
jgi:regulator of protease activity HflC (stomatin/prohibitin superfamily)